MGKQQAVMVRMPIFGLLGVAFVVLKLTKTIAWSWWWVTAPFWGPIALIVLFLAIAFGCALLVAALE